MPGLILKSDFIVTISVQLLENFRLLLTIQWIKLSIRSAPDKTGLGACCSFQDGLRCTRNQLKLLFEIPYQP